MSKIIENHPYYKFGSFVIQVPEKMLYLMTNKKGNVKEKETESLTKVNNTIRSKTINGVKIKSIMFKLINSNTPKVIHTGLLDNGRTQFGAVLIGVPKDALIVPDKNNNKYSLRDVLTKTGILSKYKGSESIIIEPVKGLKSVEVVKEPETVVKPSRPKKLTKKEMAEFLKKSDEAAKLKYKDIDIDIPNPFTTYPVRK